MNVYLTGDTHGKFGRITEFIKKLGVAEHDLIIILGDAGLNFYMDQRDYWGKLKLAMTHVNFLCIYGNHECRPENISKYTTKEFCGGKVYYESGYENIMFAVDGEVYTLPSKDNTDHKVLVCGGAYSVDKDYRLANYPQYWWKDEQPSDEIKQRVENKLDEMNWEVDNILTHTAPVNFEPTEVFLPGIDQSKVDKSTEIWLQSIYDRIKRFDKWYLGHYHCDKIIDNKIFILFNNFELL
ncbi:MAG: metallophosphoesterase [Lachnospiraceae bacterium]|nr:metallophosphoesterase [Lachnospiraceae bacterium]